MYSPACIAEHSKNKTLNTKDGVGSLMKNALMLVLTILGVILCVALIPFAYYEWVNRMGADAYSFASFLLAVVGLLSFITGAVSLYKTIKDTPKVAEDLKAAKETLIEVKFEVKGIRDMVFNLSNLLETMNSKNAKVETPTMLEKAKGFFKPNPKIEKDNRNER